MTAVIARLAAVLWDLPRSDITSDGQGQQRAFQPPPPLLPLSVTDGTACCGGNAISFLSAFAHVTAVEIDEERCDDLVHNLEVLGHSPSTFSNTSLPSSPAQRLPSGARVRVQLARDVHACMISAMVVCNNTHFLLDLQVVCGDFLAVRHMLSQHIVWIDPPWGGPRYTAVNEAKASTLAASLDDLTLGGTRVSSLCRELLMSCFKECGPSLASDGSRLVDLCPPATRMVALRLPSKISVEAFFQSMCFGSRTGTEVVRPADGGEHPVQGLIAVACRYGRSTLVVLAIAPYNAMESTKAKFKAALKFQFKVPYRFLASPCL